VREHRQKAISLRDRELQSLLQGTAWEDEDEAVVESTMALVTDYLTQEGGEGPLITASKAALRIRPEDRGDFDRLTLQTLEEFFAEHLEKAAVKLDNCAEFAAEAEHLAADAMLGAVRTRAEAQELAWQKAKAVADEAKTALRDAEKALVQSCKRAEPYAKKAAALKKKTAGLDQALAVVDRRLAGGEGSVAASPGAADNDGPGAADNDASDHVEASAQADSGNAAPMDVDEVGVSAAVPAAVAEIPQQDAAVAVEKPSASDVPAAGAAPLPKAEEPEADEEEEEKEAGSDEEDASSSGSDKSEEEEGSPKTEQSQKSEELASERSWRPEAATEAGA